jgi:hypothetical protein
MTCWLFFHFMVTCKSLIIIIHYYKTLLFLYLTSHSFISSYFLCFANCKDPYFFFISIIFMSIDDRFVLICSQIDNQRLIKYLSNRNNLLLTFVYKIPWHYQKFDYNVALTTIDQLFI